MDFRDLVGDKPLNTEEMFSLNGGYSLAYGCESYVCATKRSGAAGICTDAYCRSGVGSESPIDKRDQEY